MKKRIVIFLTLVFIFYHSAQLLGQPLPGDSGLGAASGKPVGGGADLEFQFPFLIFAAIIYACYKNRERIAQWYFSLDI